MKMSTALIRLSFLIVLLAVVTSGTGLFWQGDGAPIPFTTARGEIIQLYGDGLYRYDTLFKAPILRGTDAVTLFVAAPLLVFATLLYRRGSLRGGLLLAGMLGYFLYNSASLAFGVAYNSLHPVYIAYFSASLFAFVRAVTAIDLETLPAHVSSSLPRRGIAVFLALAGLSVFVWLLDLVGAMAQGRAPQGLASYTTEVTYVIDLGIIGPAAFLASLLVLRRAPLGYVLAAILLILNALIGVVVVAQTIAQSMAGISLSVGQLVAFVGTFVLMSVVATWLAIRLFRSISRSEAGRQNAA